MITKIPTWNAIETAYIAGIIDGEGCIGIYCKKHSFFVQITIANTNKELIIWLENKLHTNAYKMLNDKRLKNKQSFSVTVDRMRAFEILQRIKPYVIVKQKQVKLAIEFKEWQNTHTSHFYTDEDKQIFQSFVNQSRILNRKGVVNNAI